ncbi:MAG: cytochrome c biogenesis CcdA family protein [Thermocrispum sp.]
MDTPILGFALGAGLVAAVNPCGFAMLPAYLALVVLGEDPDDPPQPLSALGRALAATAAMALGFVLVFGTFGLVVAPLAGQVQRYLPLVTVVIGVLLVALGGWLLSGRELTFLLPKPSGGAPTARLGSMFGYGLAYAIASLGCTIGPFLAVTATTFRSGDTITGVMAYASYAVGMGLVVGVLAIGAALASDTAARSLRRSLPWLGRLTGALLVVVGGYVAWYGWYELRVYAGGDAEDPIVTNAGRLQNRLASWVESTDASTWALIMAAAVALALAGWLWARRRITRSPISEPGARR